jgi:hypothetical protein
VKGLSFVSRLSASPRNQIAVVPLSVHLEKPIDIDGLGECHVQSTLHRWKITSALPVQTQQAAELAAEAVHKLAKNHGAVVISDDQQPVWLPELIGPLLAK